MYNKGKFFREFGMNYNVYRGQPSRSKRLGFMGIFGRKFKRNHNYKYYDNVYLFRSGTFCDVDLSDKKNPCKEFIHNSIETLKDIRESLVVKSRKRIGVAASALAILLVLNSVLLKDGFNSNISKNDISITEKIEDLKNMKLFLESVSNEEVNVLRLSK